MGVFNHGSTEVTTDPVRIIAANVAKTRKGVLLRASLANTAKIFIGNSASVNGTDGDPNCGMPLQPGEWNDYEINEALDAGDETDVWAVAASGTQHVHWEAK